MARLTDVVTPPPFSQTASYTPGRAEELDTEVGILREKLSDALAGGLPHKSDCSVYRAPAYEPSACDCGAGTVAQQFEGLLRGVMSQFRKRGCECTFPTNDCCAYAAAETFLASRHTKGDSQ